MVHASSIDKKIFDFLILTKVPKMLPGPWVVHRGPLPMVLWSIDFLIGVNCCLNLKNGPWSINFFHSAFALVTYYDIFSYCLSKNMDHVVTDLDQSVVRIC